MLIALDIWAAVLWCVCIVAVYAMWPRYDEQGGCDVVITDKEGRAGN